MKNNFRFFTAVMSLILISAVILSTGMYIVSSDSGLPKKYNIESIAENITKDMEELKNEHHGYDYKAYQNELEKKFSEMSEISESGKKITVISNDFLENYWKGIKESGEKRSLTLDEVQYIVKDSVRIYFEYDEYVLPICEDYCYAHSRMLTGKDLPNGTVTMVSDGKQGLKNKFEDVCRDIYTIILYRLAALSTADAFIYGEEAVRELGKNTADYDSDFLESIFYIPSNSDPFEVSEKDSDARYEFITQQGGMKGDAMDMSAFRFTPTEIPTVDLLFGSGAVGFVFPTSEMEATQVNRVVNVIDKSVTESIITDDAEELFYENDMFEYYFPSVRSEYVIAVMYDGREMTLKDALTKEYITPSEFEKYEFDYIRKVKHKYTEEIPGVHWFSDQAIFTDKLSNNHAYPMTTIITSEAELKAFTDDIKAKGVFATDRRETDVPSYDEWVGKYTDEWFSKNGLVIINTEADSKVMPKINRMIVENEKITLFFSEKHMDNKKDQLYTIFFETDKTDIEEVVIIDLQ